jgi:hypothetical protein
MLHRLLSIIAVFSLVLWIIVGVLWIRGFWMTDTFIFSRWTIHGSTLESHYLYLDSDCCQFVLTFRIQHDEPPAATLALIKDRSRFNFSHGTNPTRSFTLFPGDAADSIWNRIGYDYYDSTALVNQSTNFFDRRLFLPFWFPLLLLSLLPMIQTVRIRKAVRVRKRRRLGLCLQCGYDLRSSSDICPECGMKRQPY